MSWALAITIIGITMILSFFTFALIVYLKEYKRDEKILEMQKEISKSLPAIYLATPPAPKKKKVVAPIITDPIKDDSGKNNIN